MVPEEVRPLAVVVHAGSDTSKNWHAKHGLCGDGIDSAKGLQSKSGDDSDLV